MVGARSAARLVRSDISRADSDREVLHASQYRDPTGSAGRAQQVTGLVTSPGERGGIRAEHGSEVARHLSHLVSGHRHPRGRRRLTELRRCHVRAAADGQPAPPPGATRTRPRNSPSFELAKILVAA